MCAKILHKIFHKVNVWRFWVILCYVDVDLFDLIQINTKKKVHLDISVADDLALL